MNYKILALYSHMEKHYPLGHLSCVTFTQIKTYKKDLDYYIRLVENKIQRDNLDINKIMEEVK